MDRVTRETRTRIMRAVRQRDTAPETKLAKALHARGFRYRKSTKGLPGRPDLVLRRFRVAIFVHGCFWHRHGCCKTTTPKSNTEYWLPKFEANVARDRRKHAELKRAGWRVAVVWECGVVGARAEGFDALVDELEAWIRSDLSETELPAP